MPKKIDLKTIRKRISKLTQQLRLFDEECSFTLERQRAEVERECMLLTLKLAQLKAQRAGRSALPAEVYD